MPIKHAPQKIYVDTKNNRKFRILIEYDEYYTIKWLHSGYVTTCPEWFMKYLLESGQIIRHTENQS